MALGRTQASDPGSDEPTASRVQLFVRERINGNRFCAIYRAVAGCALRRAPRPVIVGIPLTDGNGYGWPGSRYVASCKSVFTCDRAMEAGQVAEIVSSMQAPDGADEGRFLPAPPRRNRQRAGTVTAMGRTPFSTGRAPVQFPSFAMSGSFVSDRRTMIDSATATISAPP